jgi:pimeloyl-ACP methyl ester carboxylesterase
MKRLLFLLLSLLLCLVGDTSTRAITAATTTASPLITSWLGNISTRAFVQTGDNVMIGGFVVEGTEPKRVIIRAIGPELTQYHVPNALADPRLELHDGTGALIGSNDNWQHTIIGGVITHDQVQDIQNSGHAPGDARESAIIADLPAGNYTAIVRGVNNTTGVALVEVYDLIPLATSILHNISTRSFVQTGDNVMIGGFIVQGTTPKRVIIRAIGHELGQYGVPSPLGDPTLELHDGTGALIASNDDWQTTRIGGIITTDQVSDIYHSGLVPKDAFESAITATLPPGNYTAIVRGYQNSTGVALVEVYNLDPLTLETVTQPISAAQGGTITLPSGSSVTIPAGVLPSDQLVTLSLLFKSPKQPPNGFIVAVGPALSISFAPVNGYGATLSSARGLRNKSNTPLTNIEFVLNFSGSTANGFNGAAPISEYTLDSTIDNWWGPPGQIDSVNRTVIFNVDPTIFSETYGHTINDFGFIFTQGNTLGNANLNLRANIRVPLFLPPVLKYWDSQSSDWLPLPTAPRLPPGWDPNARTLTLVHGVLSSVEQAFGYKTCWLPCANGCDDGNYAVNKIAQAGEYSQVIGFDYDWTQPLSNSGSQLKALLTAYGLKNIDLEGHSEGGAVVVSAASQITDPTIQISNIVTLGGATAGTPVANAQDTMATFLLAQPPVPGGGIPGGILRASLHDLLTAPAVSDLRPGSTALQNMVRAYNNNTARSSTNIFPVAGTESMLGTETFFGSLFHNEPFDGIIGEADALLQGSSLHNVQPVGSFDVTHTELECNNDVVQAVGDAVKPVPCSTTQVQGGDTPETRNIDMGRTSGTFNFTYDTYTQPDRMVVLYQGAVLFDTGCVGQSGSVDLTYSGTSTTITVQVTPNCAGGSGTLWTFTVYCPM